MNLVDTYIITPKAEVDNRGFRDCYIDRDIDKVESMLDDELDKKFLKLICIDKKYLPIEIFSQDYETSCKIWELAEKFQEENKDWVFSNRFRGDSFLQRMRETFFETLMVIEDDYDSDKQNKFIVVNSPSAYIFTNIDYVMLENWNLEE